MFPRANYKDKPDQLQSITDDHVGTIKYDGGMFWMEVGADGGLKFHSRRPSVKGGHPERSASLPHITATKLPKYAGNVYTTELIFTGKNKGNIEQHNVLSGILNSLPPKSIATQEALGPVRVVLHDVIKPGFKTYREKLIHMKEVEKEFGRPDVLFVPDIYVGKEQIRDLHEKTKAEGREGYIITHLDKDEETNTRIKVKHWETSNLVVSAITQAIDIHGNLKDEMGALRLKDANGKEVGLVGTGFSRAQRIDALKNPSNWIGKPVQVKHMGFAQKAIRHPVYNGDPDGDIDIL